MKLTSKLFAGAAALALTLTAGSLQAQPAVIGTVTNTISISFTATLQSTNTTDKGGVTTTAAPSTHSASITTILGWLATDEHTLTNYSSSTFPAGAKLIAISGEGNSPDLQVVTKANAFLVDVTNILSLSDSGVFGSDVYSGKTSDTNSDLSVPTTTDQRVNSVTYNDTLGNGGVQFSFGGVIKNVSTDTAPKANVYKETQSHTLTSGQGDGNYFGTPFVITGGSLKAGGTGNFTILFVD